MRKAIIPLALALSVLSSCRTVHFDVTVREELFEQMKNVRSLKEEEARNGKELEEIAIEEELKEVDVEKTIVYIDRPVIRRNGRRKRPGPQERRRRRNQPKRRCRFPSSTSTA
jgi:hypothetical protein